MTQASRPIQSHGSFFFHKNNLLLNARRTRSGKSLGTIMPGFLIFLNPGEFAKLLKSAPYS
jgi:hypothetical protein